MTLLTPLPLTHSWPLFESRQRLDLGCAFDWNGVDPIDPAPYRQILSAVGVGLWDCDLTDNRLTWSTGVYDLFGLPRDAVVDRRDSVALYAEPSRAAMERLRAYAIKHRRGFTLDAEIRPATGAARWMRLVATPVCIDRKVVRLRGLKRDVTHEYR
jgi:PAS domain S-box-containing protein